MKTQKQFLLTDTGYIQYWVAEEDGVLGIGLNAFEAGEDLRHKQFIRQNTEAQADKVRWEYEQGFDAPEHN